MQIFELHFNPKLHEDRFFDSFIYEPENIYEKKLGSLYVVGELKNAFPQNSALLDNLAKHIKRNYYTFSLKSPEKAISESLKKANDFLTQELKKENVSWLGNLNFVVISIKDSGLIFTKTGDIKVLLIRGGQIINIGKNLDFQEIEPYPLKIFFNIVSGKLIPDDIILVFTKEIYEFFIQKNLLGRITELESLSGKKIKEILPPSLFLEKEGTKISGICLLAVLELETRFEKKFKEIFSQKENKFSFFHIFSPFKKPFKLIKNKFNFLKKIAKIFKKLQKRKKFPTPKKIAKRPKGKRFGFDIFKKLVNSTKFKRKLILILIFILLLFFGFLIF